MTFKDTGPAKGLTVRDVLALDPNGTLYTFVDKGRVEPTHIASGVLLATIQSAQRVPVVYCQIAPALCRSLERGDLGVEEAHALKLPEESLEAPAIVCEWGDEHVVADGAHRLWRRWKRGDADFPAYIIPERVWRHFVVVDVPGDAQFWDGFNRTARVRTPEMERLARLLGVK